MEYTLEQYWKMGIQDLEQAGIAEAELDAWYLLSEAFHVDRTHYFLQRNQKIEKEKRIDEIEAYQSMLKKRTQRIPLQQILGSQEFMSLPFVVNEHVLIPRQDTETLVELVLSEQKEKQLRVLDVCTGSGCIALSLAVLGAYQSVTASDLSKDALQVAKRNVEELYAKSMYREQAGLTVTACVMQDNENSNGFDCIWKTQVTEKTSKQEKYASRDKDLRNTDSKDKDLRDKDLSHKGSEESESYETEFRLLESDLFQNIKNIQRFDVLVSNPPYIPSSVIDELEPEVQEHEPRMALDGREDGLYFYRKLASEAGAYLNTGASIYFEIGHDQGDALQTILNEHGFEQIRIIQDLAGNDRVATAVWTAKPYLADAREGLKRGGDGPH